MIEDKLDRIITLLEGLTDTPAPAPEAAPAPAPAPAAAPVAAPAPAPAPAPVEPMTAEKLNEELIVEFNRLGSRDGIDRCIKGLGVNALVDLPLRQYDELLRQVRAL